MFLYYNYQARKYHNFEYKVRKFGISMYVSIIVVSSLFILVVDFILIAKLSDYIDSPTKTDSGECSATDYNTIANYIDMFKILASSLVLLFLKKNQDIFCCFSKVDDMARITIFQVPIQSSSDSFICPGEEADSMKIRA